MRLAITLKQLKPNQLIPINYQHAIHSFIYHTISRSDSRYSEWLHDTGLMSGNKKFKYFTFSKLDIRDVSVVDLYGSKYLNIKSENISLKVSMLSEKTTEHFIIGMFEKQKVKIYNRNTDSEFIIKTVEMIPEPVFRNDMTFRTLSPVVLSKKTIFNGSESQEYLSPADKEYEEYFKKNLSEKHKTLYQIQGSSKNESLTGTEEEAEIKTFEQKGEYKSKLITIKEGSQEENKIRGYFYTFRITGDPEVIRTGYEAGFGKQCSLGFGCAEEVRKVK